MKITIELTASYDTVKDGKKVRATWTLTVTADNCPPELVQQVKHPVQKGGIHEEEE